METNTYQPGKRKRSAGENTANTITPPARLIEKRSKKIRLDSNNKEIIDLGTIIHIPQIRPLENFEVSLEDIADMPKTVSPKEITVDINFTSGQHTYFNDSSNFYSWKNKTIIDKDFNYYLSKLTYDYTNLTKETNKIVNVNKLIKKIKDRHSFPILETVKRKKIKYIKPVKYKRKFISQDLKRDIVSKIDNGIQPKILAQSLNMKVKRVNEIYKIMKNYYKPKKRVKRYRKITGEHVDFIAQLISEKDPPIHDIVKEIEKETSLPNIKYDSVCTILRHELNCSYRESKTYHPVRYFASTRKKRVPVFEMLKENIDNSLVIFIDESGYNTNMRPTRSWQPKGKRKAFPSARLPNASLICAISKNFGVMGAQVLKGGTHKEDYEGFLFTLINEWNLPNIGLNVILFHDNAMFHHQAHNLINKLGFNNIRCEFNAIYSPMLNPIETFFSLHKRKVRKLMPVNSMDLLVKIFKSLDSISYEIINNIINHIFKLEESIRKLEII